jgi:hypothetical protein
MFYMRAYFFRPAGRSASAGMESTTELPILIATKIAAPVSVEYETAGERP